MCTIHCVFLSHPIRNDPSPTLPSNLHETGRNGIPPSVYKGQVASLILGEFLHALQQKTLHLKLHISVLQKRFFLQQKVQVDGLEKVENPGYLEELEVNFFVVYGNYDPKNFWEKTKTYLIHHQGWPDLAPKNPSRQGPWVSPIFRSSDACTICGGACFRKLFLADKSVALIPESHRPGSLRCLKNKPIFCGFFFPWKTAPFFPE